MANVPLQTKDLKFPLPLYRVSNIQKNGEVNPGPQWNVSSVGWFVPLRVSNPCLTLQAIPIL